MNNKRKTREKTIVEYSSDEETSSEEEDERDKTMYFDTRCNSVSREQIRINIRKMLDTVEFRDAMSALIKELKIKKPELFKK